jgi:hypothetical protein
VHSVFCDFIVNSIIAVSFHHDIRAGIRDYWATAEQFLTSFYGKKLKLDQSFHILRFLHHKDDAEIDRKADNCKRLQEIRTIFHNLNDAYENYYKQFHCRRNTFKIQGKSGVVRISLLGCFEEYHTKERFS